MAYQRVTLAQLKARLAERLGGEEQFWDEAEREYALNEAVAVWQLLTGDVVQTDTQTLPVSTNLLTLSLDKPVLTTLRIRCEDSARAVITPPLGLVTAAGLAPTISAAAEIDPALGVVNAGGFTPSISAESSKMVVLSASSWPNNDGVGEDNYNAHQTQHDAYSQAIVKYLTGLTSGASILIVHDNAGSGPFDTEFQDGLTRNGHTFDTTADNASWGAYDPTDYDMVIMSNPDYFDDADPPNPSLDEYLDSGGKALVHVTFGNPLSRYGLTTGAQCSYSSTGELVSVSPAPFTGNPQQHWVRSADFRMGTTTNTRGGTTTLYYNTQYNQSQMATWTP